MAMLLLPGYVMDTEELTTPLAEGRLLNDGD